MESAPDKTDSLTPSQRRAVAARGNVLVMAGAGTGKTKTLVERCLDCLERDGAAINELLIVTFTEAAAAEMRQRLRRAIETKVQEVSLNSQPSTLNFWHEQLALFDLAHIGTLHSFCLRLVREHFYELALDPQAALLDESEARQRANETLDALFTAHYEGKKKDFSKAVQELVQIHGGGRDESIRQLILRLHNYSQTRPDAAGWLATQIEQFSSAVPADWQRWLLVAIQNWRDDWLPVLENIKTENEKSAELAGILSRLGSVPAPGAVGDAPVADVRREGASSHTRGACAPQFSRETAAEILGQIISADGNWPAKRKTMLRQPLEKLFAEAAFLISLAAVKNGVDPLTEDWGWVRGHLETLLRLAQEFAAQFAESKLHDGVMDFHDLEQFALKLLWNFSANKPTGVAETWREKLRFVFVDEYQDINAAQDKIIQALSRGAGVPGAATGMAEAAAENPDASKKWGMAASGDGRAPGNRFLVGDVKQSIYRFRLADPKIFRDYARAWRGGNGEVISLSENFRSREGLLNFVNSVCGLVMREEIGGVAYDEDAELKFGSPEMRGDFGVAKDSGPRVELMLRFKSGRNETPDDKGGELADLGEAQKEARLVAWRLKQLIADQHEIFDDHAKKFRPVKWNDVAILLRSPRGKSEIFAKEFDRAGIPLAVARGRFYDSPEILDLLCLLQLLDNPLQDVPCIAVLRSPLVGLSLDELVEIRLAAREKHFWTALNAIQNEKLKIKSELVAKSAKFLERFGRWRKLAKQVSLSQCLEEILAETFYADWLRAQPRGAQRAANIAALLRLAQSFDEFQRQGLFRFLKFIEAEQAAEAEPEVSAAPTENAVHLMSIHQSKGLEFPVVVLADLAKTFNERDLHGEIIFDEEFGLCPKIKAPGSGRRYPSLAHWLAQRRQQRELRGEELRLLYVALTRARDNLILTATITEKNWEEQWSQPQSATVPKIAAARSFADWLALWFSRQKSNSQTPGAVAGEFETLRWRLDDAAEMETFETGKQESPMETAALTVGTAEKLRAVLDWKYPNSAAVRQKAKASVTELRRAAQELDDEAEPVFFPRNARNLKSKISGLKLSATETGSAHHTFLQYFDLEKAASLKAEGVRLVRENYLSAAEGAALDLTALADFWGSALGGRIRANEKNVRRELPFTARFSPVEIAEIIGGPVSPGMEKEFVVVQGAADLVVLLPAEIWLVDFKTDAVDPDDLTGKIKNYAPQLKLYAAALEKIFGRKVTLKALHFLAAGRTEEI